MNKLSPAKRAAIVSALVEGNSIRATCRMTDTAKGTVLKLLVDLGRACESYQRDVLVNLPDPSRHPGDGSGPDGPCLRGS